MDAMSELDCGDWAERNPNACPCRGRGFMVSDYDTIHACPFHRPTPAMQIAMECYRDPEGDSRWDVDWASVPASLAAMIEREKAEAWEAIAETFCAEAGTTLDALRRKTGIFAVGELLDTAEALARDAFEERADADARAAGFSCRLEAALSSENHRDDWYWR